MGGFPFKDLNWKNQFLPTALVFFYIFSL